MRKDDARSTISESRSRWLGIGIAVGLAVACGDATETTGMSGAAGGGAAGTSGAGGAGGAAAGTPGDSGTPRDGRGPVPPAAQGSVSLHVTEILTDLTRCSPGRQWVNAPSTPTPVQTQQTSDTVIGTRAIDGVDGSHVECVVQKSGDQFIFSADITTPRTDGTQALHPTVLHFEASAIGPGGPAKGTVAVMTDTTGANFADEQCSFSVTSQGSASSLDIGAGKIWASVVCQQLTHPTEPNDLCRVDAGFLVFENCAQ
ncbi:MAG TPA: hypothetical protein VK540_29795 [Polyangiaceae bacterium]|nr:hypothetical protein [Polyangiaceae bacterium]